MPALVDDDLQVLTAPDDTKLTEYREPGDHEKFAHYADKDDITRAYIDGVAIVALCGKKWVPTRDPSKFPVCPECKRLFDLGLVGRLSEWQERSSEQ